MTKINMKDQTIGIEIEMTGITRKQVAEVIAEQTGGSIYWKPGGGARITEPDGRGWDVKYDISIKAHYRPAPGRKMVKLAAHDSRTCEWSPEIASPILTYDDIPRLQELVRALFKAGARSSADLGCGIHVHVGADKHDARSLRNLVNIIYSKQELLYEALQVNQARESKYAKKTKKHFTDNLNKSKPAQVTGIGKRLDYDGIDRYYGLNLRAIWKIKTVEWRLFNGTLHAGEIKTYIQLALAISAQAINQRSASARVHQTDNKAYTFRCWLLRLGLNGDEFKTARGHLLKHLPGNKAWRNAA